MKSRRWSRQTIPIENKYWTFTHYSALTETVIWRHCQVVPVCLQTTRLWCPCLIPSSLAFSCGAVLKVNVPVSLNCLRDIPFGGLRDLSLGGNCKAHSWKGISSTAQISWKEKGRWNQITILLSLTIYSLQGNPRRPVFPDTPGSKVRLFGRGLMHLQPKTGITTCIYTHVGYNCSLKLRFQ